MNKIKECTTLKAIRGLKSFELTFGSSSLYWGYRPFREDFLDECAQVEAAIREEVTKAREVELRE